MDCQTEFLSPKGWKRIDEYDGELVAEFKLDGTAHFVQPTEYVKVPADHFVQFKTNGGIDQVLDAGHRMLLCGRRNAEWGTFLGLVPKNYRSKEAMESDAWREIIVSDLKSLKKSGRKYYVPVTFNLDNNNSKITMTNDEIRLMVAFHADGHLGYKPMNLNTPRYGFVRLKREHKKQRLRRILSMANVSWTEFITKTCPDYTTFKFIPPRLTKQYDDEWWLANDVQRRVIVDEIFNWDGGRIENRHAWAYNSRHRSDVDFIQYCIVSTGKRASISGGIKRLDRPTHYSPIYRVHMTGDGRTGNLATLSKPKAFSDHDGFMYSFSVPSTFLVLRRNGKVFITGNCGKSKVLVDDFGRMVAAGVALDLLLIAPGGCYRTWPDAIHADLPDDMMAQTEIFLWESRRAGTRTHLRAVESLMAHRGPRVLVVNAEALSIVQAARALCERFLRDRPGRNVCAVDESVVIKNGGSKLGAFVAEVLGPLSAARRILTGLIAPRSPLDLWNQFRFLDPRILGHPLFSTFQARYADVRRASMEPIEKLRWTLRQRMNLGGSPTRGQLRLVAAALDPELNTLSMPDAAIREWLEAAADGMPRDRVIESIERLGGRVQTVPIIEGYRNVDELYAKIAPHSYRCRLEDCYDMPPSDYSIRDAAWHPEQKRIYDELRRVATAELEDIESGRMGRVTANHVVVRMMRMHQVLCGHVVDEGDGRTIDVPERRTAALLELLADYDGKAVVWCAYDHNVRRVAAALAREYGEAAVARFWGGNVGDREGESTQFREEPGRRFMVATPNAGRFGRDWAYADLSIYYSCKNDLDHRAQSEDRVKAVDKDRPVAYVDVKIPGTVEDKILACLRRKIDMAAVIDGDKWREWVV